MSTAASAAAGTVPERQGRREFNVSRFAWSTLLFLLGVILWGAFVRASGSGAGCGRHWPLCNGEVIPWSPSAKTLVEFTHRLTSGIALILCVVMGWAAFKRYPAKSFSRRAAGFSVALIFLEALLGAGLVFLELVASDKSAMRAFSLGVHLMNTFFLIACVALCARFTGQERYAQVRWRRNLEDARGLAVLSVSAVFGILLLGSSGAMTALGDTLFPSMSVAEGLRQDLSPTSHFLIQLRILHPSIAVAVSIVLAIFSWKVRRRFAASLPEAAMWAMMLLLAQLAQLTLGALNILLLAPVAIQLCHLLLADCIWLILIFLLASLWTEQVPISNSGPALS